MEVCVTLVFSFADRPQELGMYISITLWFHHGSYDCDNKVDI